MHACDVHVTGRVQGVAFRAWTIQAAEELGVRGWVRNRPDGSLEAHLEGDERSIDALIERMRRGPSHARVDAIVSRPAQVERLEGFHLRR